MDNTMMLMGNQISIIFAAATATVALCATSTDKTRRFLGVSLAFFSIGSGLAPYVTPFKDVTAVLTGMLELYLLLAVFPPLLNLPARNLSVKGFLWISCLSGLGALALFNLMPTLCQDIASSPLFVLAVGGVGVLAIGRSYNQPNFKLYLLLLLPITALFIRFAGGHTLIGTASSYVVSCYALILIGTLASEQNQKTASMNEEFTRLQNEFEDEVQRGVRMRTFHIEQIKERMAEVNRIDHLTKALNRKAVIDKLDDLTANKTVQKFVMLLFDIDDFKGINDTLGHNIGDECLKTLSSIAVSSIRDMDFLGRYGGDEFIILLPNLTLKDGLHVAERFRLRVAETHAPHFSISIGAAAYPWDGSDFKSLLSTADKGLYAAKQQGRNTVSYAGYIKINEDGTMVLPDELSAEVASGDDNLPT